jgi:hypothetical protein
MMLLFLGKHMSEWILCNSDVADIVTLNLTSSEMYSCKCRDE